MSTRKKTTTPKPKVPVAKTKVNHHVQLAHVSPLNKIVALVKKPFIFARMRIRDLLARRPHRSFRRTRRRDYARSLKLPGYWALTNYVRKTLWQHKKLFIGLAVVYCVLVLLLNGLASQDTYTELSEALKTAGGNIFNGQVGELSKAAVLLGSGIIGAFNSEPTDVQRVYAAFLALLAWLTTVWLLRGLLAGNKPKLRDGLYSASAPFLSTFLLSLLAVLQLLPIAIASIAYGAASASGLLNTGVEAMLFWCVALLLGSVSLYWMTTTVIALVVVTLPGMYPLQAFKAAGDLVIGRRVRILLRFIWLVFITALLWILIMVPIILFDTWLKSVIPSITWVPIVPVALLLLGSITVVWAAGYVYLLYRKVVDDDTAPA